MEIWYVLTDFLWQTEGILKQVELQTPMKTEKVGCLKVNLKEINKTQGLQNEGPGPGE